MFDAAIWFLGRVLSGDSFGGGLHRPTALAIDRAAIRALQAASSFGKVVCRSQHPHAGLPRTARSFDLAAVSPLDAASGSGEFVDGIDLRTQGDNRYCK